MIENLKVAGADLPTTVRTLVPKNHPVTLSPELFGYLKIDAFFNNVDEFFIEWNDECLELIDLHGMP